MTQWQPSNDPGRRAAQYPVAPPQGPQPWVPLEQRPHYGQPYAGWRPPQWQPPRKRSWVARHKVLTGVLSGAAVLVAGVIAIAASSGSGPDTASLAACTSHHAVSSRQWLQVTKDPEAAKGQCITVYGEVTQFDSVTGDGTFRAQAGGTKASTSFGFANYPTNALFDGGAAQLGALVQDDLFKASATVAGSQTYNTTLGGSTTVPVFRVDSITRTGHLGN